MNGEFEMTDKEIQDWKDRIDKMSQYEMASLQRFAPIGHHIFNSTLPLADYFQVRFTSLGGMTPEISKSLGWER